RIEAATDLEELRPLDRAFHGTVSAAAGNDLLAELHAKVLDAVFGSAPFEELLHGEPDAEDARRVLLVSARAHAAIARAVTAGDVAAAGAAARAHLDDVEGRLAG
ncbi:MAG TPA: FCD domain-containing protein, partial [Ilumatobacteraceae bacterium]|nr:FCD domain-containing protein [Ilumatobacteraceae bacterium]